MEKSRQELALERVREMEEILQSQREELTAMQNALRIFADSQRAYRKLVKYYYSRNFTADNKRFDRGELSALSSAEVLTEDAVYDMMGERYELTLEMLELATKLIRER